jgi:hypothetical protein
MGVIMLDRSSNVKYSSRREKGMPQPSNRIRLTLVGWASEGGHVRLDDFQQELLLLGQALKATDRALHRQQTTYYRVVDLRHESPAQVELEAAPRSLEMDRSAEVVASFGNVLAEARTGFFARTADYGVLTALRRMAEPVGKTLVEARIETFNGDGHKSAALDEGFRATLGRMLAPEEEYDGKLRGMLEAINVHAGTNEFRVYPDVGPEKVTCAFDEPLRKEALEAVGHFVEVAGILRRKRIARFPHRMRVLRMAVLDDEPIPSLWDLRGVAPNMTGDLTSAEFIKQLRDARP